MPRNSHQKKLINKMVSKKVLDSNDFAVNTYDNYKRTSDIIERTNCALGRKPIFKTTIGSTLNCKINSNAISSTTSQKI
jgi:hypothetical protein